MHLPEPPELAAFLAPYPPSIQDLARRVRNRLVAILPPCIETLWDATNAVGTAYGFTEKNSDHFIHLPVYSKHVNLGFSQGARLSDPEGRLQGTGARVRHVRLQRVEDLDDPALRDLIQQALELAGGKELEGEPRTLIRVMEGPKKRPRPS